jgi:nucleotide-binding universal stress UspA family protein
MSAKRILIVFEGGIYQSDAVDCAIKLCKSTGGILTGVFVHHTDYSFIPAGFGVEPQPFDYSFEAVNQALETDISDLEKSRRSFTQACSNAGISFSIFCDGTVNTDELLAESKYADLVIAGYNKQAKDAEDPAQPVNNLVGRMLEDFGCPVLLILQGKPGIEQLVFTYDGRIPSVQIIRDFTYLLSGVYNKLPCQIMIPERTIDDSLLHSLKAYLDVHFPQIKYTFYSGKEDEAVNYYIANDKVPALLMLGITHRSFLSRLFSAGNIDGILQAAPCALFISHC